MSSPLPDLGPPPPPKRSFLARTWEVWTALGAALVFLVLPIGRAGIWDPFELGVAELSRRIAINVLRGGRLVIEGAENGMPRLGDLGRGELPFDSMALGFRVFGLHEWSGRLPLALWGVAGAMSLYWVLARLVDRRAALYGALVLVTMPLYFLHARTMLGDIVTMAASVMAFAGLAIAVFDRGRGASLERHLAVALAVVGLASGFMCRGPLIGVALPALAVGLAWGVTWGALDGRKNFELYGDIVGGLALLVGAAAAGVGIRALMRATPTEFSMLVGTAVSTQPKFPTFDFVILYLGHSLLPWSAFIPFAAGRLFREPPLTGTDPETEAARRRETSLRLGLVVGSTVALGGYALIAPRVGYIPFGAPALLAAIAAVAIRDFERGAPSSRAIGVGVAVLAALFLRDYNMFPEKGLSAFGVAGTFPDSLKQTAENIILYSTIAFSGLVLLAWLEKENEPSFRWRDYVAWPRTLVKAWHGNLLLLLIAVELALAVLAAMVFLGLRFFHWKQVLALGLDTRVHALNTYWRFPLALFGVVWGAMAIRDLFRLFIKKTGVPRGAVSLLAGVVVGGGLLSFWYYPALGAQISPKEVFDAYRHKHHGDEPLGLLGVGGRSASYSSGGDVKMFTDVNSAYTWLTAVPTRRWLAVRADDLLRLNSTYRARVGDKRENLPVLDGRSSQIMLVSNLLLPGEVNQSPLSPILFGSEPPIQHTVSANLQDQLESLGWEVRDDRGKIVDSVIPDRKYRFRLFYRVIAPVSGEWETFVHIDGFRRRYNGDHKTLGGKYPFNLWQPGDYVVDDSELQLEPNFTPGQYNVYYGLYVGETRMKVKSGRQDDNRIEGGALRVQ